jgi:hypothetical protein
MRGQRPAYRVGRSDSRLTGTAAGANLAAMLAILQAVIGTLRSALRHRASLVAENLVLRQQLAILRRTTPPPGFGRSTVRFGSWSPVGGRGGRSCRGYFPPPPHDR